MASQLHPRPIVRYRKPVKDEAYLKWIREQKCLTCKPWNRWFGLYLIEAAHTRVAGEGGMGTKTGDDSCIPLCSFCHRHGPNAYHKYGDEADWAAHHDLKLDEIKADLRRRYVGGDDE